MDNNNNRSLATRDTQAKNESGIRTNHLLLIGIDKYTNGVRPLDNAVRDAVAFRDVLLDKFQMKQENITELLDENATRANIIGTFSKLIDSLTSSDNLIIYFSGHGELIDRAHKDEGYWIPVDAKLDDTGSYITNERIQNFFSNLQAHHVLGIIDSCFSGSLLLRDIGAVAQRYYNIPSRWIMTSGAKEPVSDGHGKHSPFAASLLTQLKNNPSNAIGVSTLWTSMREGVVANANQTPLCQPITGGGHQGGEFFFLSNDVKEVPETITQAAQAPDRNVGPETPIAPPVKPEEEETKITDIDSLKKDLKMKVAMDELDKAFKILSDVVSSDSSHQMTILVRMGGYSSLKEKITMGTINDPSVEKAKIRNALLSVIGQLEDDDLVEDAFSLI